jgi:demethylmenaquinone methyltransferase/2-methoxy-6-polyprenyl-1,4-benzoquinol methylase
VRSMFDSIAGRYDLLNHVLSMQQDRLWRRRAAKVVLESLSPQPGRATLRVLDLCCGTGDLSAALAARDRSAQVIGADFSLPMLNLARSKGTAAGHVALDALALPLVDSAFDAVTVAFGVRNYADRAVGFAEARRVLRRGGRFAVLEFVQPPRTLFGALFRQYSKHVLPRLGAWIAGSKGAYTYLPESIAAFLTTEQLAAEIGAAGFTPRTVQRFAFGTVALIVAERAE